MTKPTLPVEPILTDDQLAEVLDVATRTALKHGAETYEAQEVAQLTSIKLLDDKKRAQVQTALGRGRDGWRNFVSTVARNTYRDCVRSHERRIARERRAIGVVGEPLIDRPAVHRSRPQNPTALEEYLSRLAVVDAIDELESPRQRACMEAIYLHGLSITETAQELEINPQTVRFHLRHALANLREHLTP